MLRRDQSLSAMLPRPFFETHPVPMLLAAGSPPRLVGTNHAFTALCGGGDLRDRPLSDVLADLPPRDDGTAYSTQLLSAAPARIEVDVTAQPVGEAAPAVSLLTVLDKRTAHAGRPGRSASDALAGIAGEVAGIGGWHADLATGRVTWSERIYRLFGIDPSREIGMEPAIGLVAPEHRERLVEAVERCMREGRPYDLDIVASDSSGTQFPVRAIGEPVRDETGSIVALQGAAQDLRPVRQAARSFTQDRDSFERLADAMPHIVWTALPDGTPDYVSRRVRVPFGNGDRAGTARAWARAIHPDDRGETARRWAAAVERGVAFETECRIRRDAAADYRWHQTVAHPLRDEAGEIVRWFGTGTDVHERRQAEEQTRQLATRLRTILDSITDAFVTVDAGFRVQFLNREAQAVLGYTAEELTGRNLWEAFPAAAGTIFEREYRAVLATRSTRKFRAHYAPMNLWVDVSAYPADGGIAIYFRDVTAAQRREERLRLLQLAVERITDAVLITEAEPLGEPGPRIQFVNDAFTRQTGFAAGEAVGRSPRLLQGPGTDRAALDRIRAALSAREPVREELLNYRKDGRPFWIELDIAPLVRDDGRCTHWVAIQRDITERKHAEDSAARRAAQLAADNEALQRLTTMTGPRETALARMVSEIADLAGAEGAAFIAADAGGPQVGAAEGVTATLAQVTSAWGDGLWAQAVASGQTTVATMRDGMPASPELRALKDAGARAAAVAPVDRGGLLVAYADPGQPDENRLNSLRIYARTAESVLQRIRVEEQLRQAQRLESLGQLTGGIAHDFNNLLTIILGNAQMLSESLSGDDGLRPLAEMTQTAAMRGAELTNRLLSFARKQSLDAQPTDVAALIDGMALMLERTLGSSIDVAFSHNGALWLAMIDAPQLENAVLNLCLNARDAMPEGGSLTIETRNVQIDDGYAGMNVEVAAGDYVLVAVSDTGTGMPPEIRERAFEPFFTTKPVDAGSGLGLSMVFGFVKQSRGHVQVYSEPGMGTTVKLYLPRAIDGAETLREPAGPAALGGAECILVVEDDALVREHVTAMLDGLGYRVLTAGDAMAALALLRAGRPVDLLFTDVVMPGGMDGAELADAARRIRPGLPVLLTSGYTETAMTRRNGPDRTIHLLTKPYRRMDLATKLRRLLDDATKRGDG